MIKNAKEARQLTEDNQSDEVTDLIAELLVKIETTAKQGKSLLHIDVDNILTQADYKDLCEAEFSLCAKGFDATYNPIDSSILIQW